MSDHTAIADAVITLRRGWFTGPEKEAFEAALNALLALLAEAQQERDEAIKQSLTWERLAKESNADKAAAERLAERRGDFIAHTLDEYGHRLPGQWKAHARAALADGGQNTQTTPKLEAGLGADDDGQQETQT